MGKMNGQEKYDARSMKEPHFHIMIGDPQKSEAWFEAWDNFQALLRKRRKKTSSTLNFHKKQLGKQDFYLVGTVGRWVSRHRYWVWDRPTYRAVIGNGNWGNSIILEVPSDKAEDLEFCLSALKDYTEDLGVALLPREEQKSLWDQGYALGRKHRVKIPRMTDDQLREFILARCDGKIFTSADAHDRDMPMVFMTLALGAHQPEDAVREVMGKHLPPDPGDEPSLPDAPQSQKVPKKPQRPAKPKVVEPDDVKVTYIQSEIEWMDMRPSALDDYYKEIRDKNEEAQKKYQRAMVKYEAQCEVHAHKLREIKEAHQAALAEYEARCGSLDGAIEAWEVAKAQYDAASKGFFEGFDGSLGLVYEYYSAAGPRCVNGMPMFTSHRIMHKLDVQRADPIIQREVERRKNFKI